MARALDAEWVRCGRPDRWLVVEAGAGSGSLALAILGAAPECASALRYVAVEISPVLRAAATERLPVELPALVLGPGAPPVEDAPASGRSSAGELDSSTGRGPLVTVLGELPEQPFSGMVLANELLDNLPFDLVELRDGAWHEVVVGEGDGRTVDMVVPATPADAELATRLAPDAVDGARLPLQRAAAAWLGRALRLVERGRVLAIDYCSPSTAALARRPQHEWLRTYRGHTRGGDPLDDPGSQDITCEVAVDQLARVRPPSGDHAQAAWLVAHGLEDLVAVARAAWEAGVARPDLTVVAARSRLAEAAALTDPAGLGAFRVLEWASGAPSVGSHAGQGRDGGER